MTSPNKIRHTYISYISYLISYILSLLYILYPLYILYILYILYLIPYTFYLTFYLTWTFAGHQWASHQAKKSHNKTRKYFFMPRSILMLPGFKIPIKSEKITNFWKINFSEILIFQKSVEKLWKRVKSQYFFARNPILTNLGAENRTRGDLNKNRPARWRCGARQVA